MSGKKRTDPKVFWTRVICLGLVGIMILGLVLSFLDVL